MPRCAAVKALGVVSARVAAMMPAGPANGSAGGDRISGDLGPAAEKMLESSTSVQRRNGRARTLAYLQRALKDAAAALQPPALLRPLGPGELQPPRPPHATTH